MDNELKKAKAEYENIEIPPKLNHIVSDTLRSTDRPPKKTVSFFTKCRIPAVSTAAVLIVFMVAELNFNQTFAESASAIPVIGDIARLVTFTQYRAENDILAEDVTVPRIEGMADADVQNDLNTKIQSIVTEKKEEAEAAAKEYEEAYLQTNGDPDAINQIQFQFGYDIKCRDNGILSFELYANNTLANAYNEYYYYTIDLDTEQSISLADLLGPDYKQIVDANVKTQIEERAKDPANQFFAGDMGFQGISGDQDFYVNGDGAVVAVFQKYEIAPGYMGQCEFVIDPSVTEYVTPTPPPTPSPTPSPSPTPTPTPSPAVYGTLLAESEKMDSEYFKNIYFIGDSRTVAMGKYHFVSKDRIFAQDGLNHVDAETNDFLTMNGENVTIAQAVGIAKPKVAIVSFGVNGIAWIGKSKFMNEYQKLLDMFTEASPDTQFIIQSIYPVSAGYTQKDSRLSNAKIDEYNQDLYEMAEQNHMYYLSTSDVLKADDGSLLNQYDCGDGLHLSESAYTAIFKYIKTHKIP